jgi:nucleotide-binding universal stress UspA family protein
MAKAKPAINRILFPVDFSEECIGAARYVEALAGRFQAELTLLHILDTGAYFYPDVAQPGIEKRLEEFLAEELKYFDTHRLCLMGEPAAQIVEVVKSWKPDLVMMPTHGLGAYRRLLLGSVTAKVLHDVECPAWTGIHSEKAPPLERIACRKVLCSVDLQNRSASVLEWASFLAKEYDADLGIVHATPAPHATPSRFPDPEFLTYIESEAEKRIADLQASMDTTARVSLSNVFIQEGDPAEVVACAAKQFGADLLIIGRHGGGGHLRQNAYAILRKSPCPVISI